MRNITGYLKIVFPHSSWLSLHTQRVKFVLSLYYHFDTWGSLGFYLPGVVQVLASRADSNSSWVWTWTVWSYISQLNPDLQRQTWHCKNGWEGMCKSTRSSQKLCSKSGFPISFACGVVNRLRKVARVWGGEGVALLTISQCLKLLSCQERGENVTNIAELLIDCPIQIPYWHKT